jgi:hypothetical protein
MVSATVVLPDPAGTLTGENAAVAPEGKPLIDSAIAFDKLPAPFAGLTVNVFPIVPPGNAVAELTPPATLIVKSVAAGKLIATV